MSENDKPRGENGSAGLKAILVEDTTRFYFVPDKPNQEVEPWYYMPKKLQSVWQSDAVEEAKRTYGPGTVLKAVATIEKTSG